jgi:DNA-binding response OmpR family regulator
MRVLLTGSHSELASRLREAGHDVDAAADGSSAIRAAEASTHDVVILDLDGTEGDPYALARHVRAASYFPKPLFVGLAQALDPNHENRSRAAGIDLLLAKPVQPGLLTGFLDRLSSVVADYESFDPMI